MSRCVVALALASTLAACKQPSSSAKPALSASSSAVVRAPSREADARFQGKQLDEIPLELGPLPDGAALSAREQHVQELMSGLTSAERLPLVATDASVSYDSALYRRLTTKVVPRSRATASIEGFQLLSGALDETQASRVTSSFRAGLRACYQRALSAGGALSSVQVSFEVTVLETGDVAEVKPIGKLPESLLPFLSCARARIQASQFQAPSKPSRFRFSVTLSNPSPLDDK